MACGQTKLSRCETAQGCRRLVTANGVYLAVCMALVGYSARGTQERVTGGSERIAGELVWQQLVDSAVRQDL